ncbi:MAG: TRAP transporter large permease [Planctomycetota bacterium]
MILAIFFILFFVLLLLKCPVSFSMLLAALGFMVLKGTLPILIIPERLTISLDSFPLLAVPFFILAGSLMNKSGIASRIFNFALSIFGHFKAGLAHVNVVASMIFAGMSGSAYADAAGLGALEVKAMTDDGYDKDFSAAVTAVSSCIGPVIPPSVIMVLFGVMAEVSIGELFAAGMIPGILMGIFMMLTIAVLARTGKIYAPQRKRASFGFVLKSFRKAFFPLLGPVFILGTILLGIATPTEAGIVAILYAFVLGLFYKNFTLKSLSDILEEAVLTTGRIMFIIAAANVFGWLVTMEQVAQVLYNVLTVLTTQKWLILLMVNFILLLLGCAIESMAVFIVSLPALLPLMKGLGMDLVQFGIVMVVNIMIALITPPVGMTLYIVSDLADTKFDRVVKHVLPFLIPMFVTLMLVTYWDSMVMFLPNLLFR